MMNQSKTSVHSVGRYLPLLPLILLMLTADSLHASLRESAEVDLISSSSFIPAIPLQVQRHSQQQPPPEKHRVERFIVVNEIPEFVGGNSALMRFLSENIQYPAIAKENGIQGRVICSFIVMADGSIRDLYVERGVDSSLDAEAMRVLRMMPDWKPGGQEGVPLNMRISLPIDFRLPVQKEKTLDAATIETEDIFINVDVPPEFPGGVKEMMKFISDNITYPGPPNCQNIHGRVICQFLVKKDGTITDVKVVHGLHPHLDAEAVHVLQSMPKWKPGTHHGQAVDVLFTTAVVFRLQG